MNTHTKLLNFPTCAQFILIIVEIRNVWCPCLFISFSCYRWLDIFFHQTWTCVLTFVSFRFDHFLKQINKQFSCNVNVNRSIGWGKSDFDWLALELTIVVKMRIICKFSHASLTRRSLTTSTIFLLALSKYEANLFNDSSWWKQKVLDRKQLSLERRIQNMISN